MITLIVAMDKDGTIGRNGELPWHSSEDLKWFKQTTIYNTVIMGRRTWESLKIKPLPNRINVVVSKTLGVSQHFLSRSGALWVYSITDAMNISKLYTGRETFIIGGAQLYKSTLEMGVVDRMLITVINQTVESNKNNIVFPDFEKSQWSHKTIKDTGEFKIIELTRKIPMAV